MEREKNGRERADEEKARVNPAARRDRPGEEKLEEDRRKRHSEEVHPAQEEPLDPLGPGGIGG